MTISTTILSSTSYISGTGGLSFPLTVTLKSADATRKIEFSSDGGVEYFSPGMDIASTTMLVTHSAIPITNIRVTGVISDTLILVN